MRSFISFLICASLSLLTVAPLAAQPAEFHETFRDQGDFNADWTRSSYTGVGGTRFSPSNVTVVGRNGGFVRLRLEGASGGEIVTRRDDFHFGRYRFRARVMDTRSLKRPQGMVFGMFLYRDDTNEIDIEMLTREGVPAVLSNDRIFFTAYSLEGCETPSGGCVPAAGPWAFDPSLLFGRIVEYGFDWKPDRIDFYVAGVRVRSLVGAEKVPQEPGHLIVNLWSGIPSFGGTFPARTVVQEIHQVDYLPDFYLP